ncbi:DUF721 domain-containing protein [Corynebacterium sphenisci]|uniref:DUF721 domain-containing protein n=1 Tax=Corynebacterium sphenisci TaxID=191493 RepID=UPI0026E02E9F|nr:DciA family protein [Corynebacterium sphenisci]MDO5731389.1 DciA family protein [Corynebacterium sphenisci]
MSAGEAGAAAAGGDGAGVSTADAAVAKAARLARAAGARAAAPAPEPATAAPGPAGDIDAPAPDADAGAIAAPAPGAATVPDLVAETFTRLRRTAGRRGRVPSLGAPPRRGGPDPLAGRPRRDEAEAVVPGLGPVGGRLAETGFFAEARDRAGTRIPEHLQGRGAGGPRVRRYRRTDPQPLGTVLIRQILDRGWAPQMARGMILTRWPEIVGEELAAQVRIDSFDEGTLLLRASSTAWATQLRYLQDRILARIAEEVGDGVVTRLRIIGPPAPTWRKGRYGVRGRGPRDTYG